MPWQPAAAVASSAAPAVPRAARTAVAVVVSAKGNAMSDSKKGCQRFYTLLAGSYLLRLFLY